MAVLRGPGRRGVAGRSSGPLNAMTPCALGRWARRALLGLSAALLCSPGSAFASESAAVPLASAVSLYQGQGVDSNLREVLPDLFTGDLRFEDTSFTAVGLYRPLGTPRFLQSVFDFVSLSETGTGLELIAAKHYGLQYNWEIDAAYLVRFPRLRVAGLSVRFGVGFGFSYALGLPSYEDGPKDDPDRRYRFQNYDTFELEWGLEAVRRVSLVTRIHHRSGMYGLIAPQRVGSNFLALGLRYSL